MKFWLTRASDFIWRNIYMCITILTAVVCTCDFLLVYAQNGHLFYMDTDCYMRAVRIIDWLQDFQWSEKIFPYTNPPFNLHFTRICDVIWLLLSLPFMLFAPLKEAIFYGGFLFSPLFLILTLLVLIKCYKVYMPKMHRYRMFFILCSAYSLMLFLNFSTVFLPHRPDHHSLMVFVFAFNLMVILCSYASVRMWEFAVAGLLAGLGMLASSAIEGLLVSGSILAVLCFDWICDVRSVKQLLLYTWGLFTGTVFLWLLDPPMNGYAILDNNRLCIIHVVLTALIFLSFMAIYWKNPQGTVRKIVCLSVSVVSVVMIMMIVFGFKQFTVSIYDENIKEYFLPYVSEMFPILKFDVLLMMHGLCLMEFLALLFLSKGKLPYLNDLGILLVIYMILGFVAVRFCAYFLTVYIIVNVFLFFVLMHMDFVEKSIKNIYKISFFAIFIFTMGCMFSFSINRSDRFSDISIPAKKICLTGIFEAPRLIFEHNIYSIGSPYHSDIEGILLNKNIWLESDENILKDLFRRYHISCVIVPSTTANFKALPNTFWYKIASGTRVYPWLIKKDGFYIVDEKLLEEN